MGLLNKLMGIASQVAPEKLKEKYGRLLVDGEDIELGFTLFRDVFIFTDKRLILIDVQGITGSKVEYRSLPKTKIPVTLYRQSFSRVTNK